MRLVHDGHGQGAKYGLLARGERARYRCRQLSFNLSPQNCHMPKINGNEIRPGNVLEHNGGLWAAVKVDHVKPGKGGAFVRTTLKNVRSGSTIDRTFRAGERVERAFIEKRDQQYLYRDGADYVVMDTETYEQRNVPAAALGDAAGFMVENSTVTLILFKEEIVGVDLPAAVELTVAETEPGLQGDRVSGARKPATLETGLVIQVPLFVGPGEKIKVDTRTGEYMTRV